MKTIFILLSFFVVTLSYGQMLEARPFAELLGRIEKADFTYKETGKMFGFNSTQSCLHISEDIVIFKNYCFPVKDYPARGYTIITRESGVIGLYEEKIPGVLVRELRIEKFPVFLVPYLRDPLPTYTLSDLSGILAELYPHYFPGCWSTNFSRYIETEDANCSGDVSQVVNFNSWAQETQTIVNDEAAWLKLMDTIEAKLIRL